MWSLITIGIGVLGGIISGISEYASEEENKKFRNDACKIMYQQAKANVELVEENHKLKKLVGVKQSIEEAKAEDTLIEENRKLINKAKKALDELDAE